ncbi:MAG: BatD family protein [Glaciecola sp.]
MRILQLIALLVFSNLTFAQLTQLTASVDRNTILVDEAFELTIIANGDASRDDLDLSPLQKDFRVSRPSFSQSTQIINGTMSKNISWTVNLYPLTSGNFTIPSFSIDGINSNSFAVTVLARNAQNNAAPRDYYVDATVNQETVYLQQQLLYTIKIHLSQDIQRGNLGLPELDGALIEQVGEDKDYQEIIDGVRYRIIERNYAIIPQSSGTFTITGPIFEAQVLSSSRQSFANFGRTRTIARRAPDITIDVQAMPSNYNYPWLPSEYVEVNEQWQGDATTLTVGEPVTRTITLTAIGLTKEQLPSLSTPYHPNFKVYPEQPQFSSVEHQNAIVAQGVYNTAVIPSSEGDYVLPEVKVPWFNVKTGTTEFATIPARTITVVPNNNQPSKSVTPETKDTSDDVANTSRPIESDNMLQQRGFAPWMVYALLATNVFTLVLAMVLWLSKRAPLNPVQVSANTTSKQLSEEQHYKALKQYLEQGKTAELSALLDTWLLALRGTNHQSVSQSLSKAVNSSASNSALYHYNQVLKSQYSSDDANIDFAAFIKSLHEYREHVLNETTPAPLSAMYPT